MSAFLVVLDTCVLYPSLVRNILLRAAAHDLYRAHWSADTLIELRRNLIANLGESKTATIERTIALMQQHFPDATLYPPASLVAAMTNDPKDRHVIAAAVSVKASVIVTDNLKDFPTLSVEPHQIEMQSADEFLMTQFGHSPAIFLEIAEHILATYKNPPYTVEYLRKGLDPTVPGFASMLASKL